MRKISRLLVLAAGAGIATPALAYIDPGTGSALIQGLIAAVAAIGVTLKLYWHRFIALFSKAKDGSDTNASEPGQIEHTESRRPD